MSGYRRKTFCLNLPFQPVNIVDDAENWEAENFCLKMLCENEEVGYMETFSWCGFSTGSDSGLIVSAGV